MTHLLAMTPGSDKTEGQTAYPGVAETILLTTQWFLPIGRIRSNPTVSNIDTLPL